MELGLPRREFLAGLCAAPWLTFSGCQPAARRLPPEGEIVDRVVTAGHRLRAGMTLTVPEDHWHDVGVLIVGAGVAGLSAAWELRRRGISDFLLIEMDAQPGGTAQSTRYGEIPAPWGAHYLPLPLAHQTDLISLLDEMGVLEGKGPSGEPIAAEQVLCREPEERLFHQGVWHEGLFLFDGASEEDLRQWTAFQAEMQRWAAWKDGQGRRAFTIPVSHCSRDPEVLRLDDITFADWLQQQGWTSPRVQWSLDYACRDDYGLKLAQTSAWAGIFYFAARLAEDLEQPQPLLTWPEGNGRIVDYLQSLTTGQLLTQTMVAEVIPADTPDGPLKVLTIDEQGTVRGYHAQRVIWGAPQFVAGRVIRGFREDPQRAAALAQFQYGSWFVANLCLANRPTSAGFPFAWDNVFYDSPSLGYVVATHQQLRDHGPTVWTYYYPLCGDNPAEDRQWLLDQSWDNLAELVLSDLETAHPEIRTLTTRLDIQRWGHAMIRPTPGVIWHAARQSAADAWRGIHFAHTDLSGLALCEEAFDHGVRAAREIAAAVPSLRGSA